MPSENAQVNRESSTTVSGWETAERIAKTVSIALIPVVLAVGGWIIQARLADQTVRRDYVQLAVTILKDPPTQDNGDMREWAAKLLANESPVPFSATTISNLKEGKVALPASFTIAPNPGATQAAQAAANETAGDLESKGFGFLFERNYNDALAAFTQAEKQSPEFHNVSEIRKLLVAKGNDLKDPQKADAWKDLYRTVQDKYSWRLSPETKNRLSELIKL
jgi:hypothetical protein